MFDDILKTAQNNINTVRCILKMNKRLRDDIYDKDNSRKKLDNNINELPDFLDWCVFDHCAAVTRLYAIYEQFVEDLITDWLNILPKLYPRYDDLPEKIQQTHYLGVGVILRDRERYNNLSTTQILQGLFAGVTQQDSYQLLPAAFLTQEQNLWDNIIDGVFKKAGIDNFWNWTSNSRYVNNLNINNTPQAELQKFIRYRNDAAHRGNIDEVLGFNELLELTDFIEAMCQAMVELVIDYIRVKKLNSQPQQAVEVGVITEWFKKPEAGILISSIDNLDLSVNQRVFLSGEFYCQLAKIISIKVDDQEVNLVQSSQSNEIGLKFNVPARKNLKVYVIKDNL